MSSKQQLKEEAKALMDSLTENVHEIELSIKSGSANHDESLSALLTSLKKVRFELRVIVEHEDPDKEDMSAELEKEWEIISTGRKLLEEQKKIIKNR